MATTGKVTGIVSNLVTVQVDGPVAENELCSIDLHGTGLLAEVIRSPATGLPCRFSKAPADWPEAQKWNSSEGCWR